MKTEMTVKEAIDYAIDNGIEQAEKQLNYWNKYGRLVKNNAKSLERSLLQLHETVEFDGYGKRGKVYLGKKHSEIQERDDNRGHQTTPEEEEFERVLHRKLIKMDFFKELEGKEHSISRWIDILQIRTYHIDPYGQKFSNMRSAIESYYKLKHSADAPFFNSYVIVLEHMIDYNQKMKNILINTLKRLDKKGYLDYTTKSYGYNNTKNLIENETYAKFKKRQSELIKNHGYSFQSYYRKLAQYTAFQKTLMLDIDSVTVAKEMKVEEEFEKFVKDKEEIESTLVEEYGYSYVYQTHAISNIKGYSIKDMTEEELAGIFGINGAAERYYMATTKTYRYERNKKNYAESTYFHRRFFLLSSAFFLKDYEIMEELGSTFEEDLKEYIRDFDVNYYLAEVEQVEAFGEEQFIKYSDQLRANFWEKRNQQKQDYEKFVSDVIQLHDNRKNAYYKKQQRKKLEEMTGVDLDLSIDDFLEGIGI